MDGIEGGGDEPLLLVLDVRWSPSKTRICVAGGHCGQNRTEQPFGICYDGERGSIGLRIYLTLKILFCWLDNSQYG